MQYYSNNHDLSLSVAIPLAADFYEHNDDPYHISATSLLKSTRELVLTKRLLQKQIDTVTDLASNIHSCLGSAFHMYAEQAWLTQYKDALRKLQFSPDIIDRIIINPTEEKLAISDIEDPILIYLEQRTEKQIGKWTISGQFDFVCNGYLEDFKTTSVYTYINQTNADKYKWQGSIYKWLAPEIITGDHITIQYIFNDWQEWKINTQNYPPSKILAYEIPLYSVEIVEEVITHKLAVLESLENTPEAELPLCTPDELWSTPAKYAYYKKIGQSKCTKIFTSYYEAQERLIKDGSIGEIVERPGKVKYCAFCGASALCTQKDQYIANGSLIL